MQRPENREKFRYVVCIAHRRYVEIAVNNDISNIRIHLMELDLCGIKVGCHIFGTLCIVATFKADVTFYFLH